VPDDASFHQWLLSMAKTLEQAPVIEKKKAVTFCRLLKVCNLLYEKVFIGTSK
jgi:hypothetical protein